PGKSNSSTTVTIKAKPKIKRRRKCWPRSSTWSRRGPWRTRPIEDRDAIHHESILPSLRTSCFGTAHHRPDRRGAGDAESLHADAPGGALQRLRAVAGRDWHGQGANRQGHPPVKPARQRPF